MKNSITINQSVFIRKSKYEVWDFTQDYAKRKQWDASVISTEVLHSTPNRMVRLKLKGNTTLTMTYKLDDRPNKTSLKVIEMESPILKGGGGSWNYVEENGGTRWTRTDTLIFKESSFTPVFLFIFKLLFKFQIKVAMKKVKKILEGE